MKHILFGLLLVVLTQNLAVASNLKTMKQEIGDALITAKIDAKLAEKAKVNPLKLKVTTRSGKVKLRGSVSDKERLAEVLTIVKTTQGVKSVDARQVKIQTVNMPITDAYITAKVEATLLKSKVFDDESIPLVGVSAHTVNGVVTLSGYVKKQSSIPKIMKRVHAINGVKSVVNHLKVKAVY